MDLSARRHKGKGCETGMNKEILRYKKLSWNELSFYRAYGYLLLPGLISRDAADQLAAEVLQVMEGLGIARQDLCRATTSKDKLRQSSQYLAGTAMEQLIHSDGLLQIAAQLMGGQSTLYLPFTAVKAAAGAAAFTSIRTISTRDLMARASTYGLLWAR